MALIREPNPSVCVGGGGGGENGGSRVSERVLMSTNKCHLASYPGHTPLYPGLPWPDFILQPLRKYRAMLHNWVLEAWVRTRLLLGRTPEIVSTFFLPWHTKKKSQLRVYTLERNYGPGVSGLGSFKSNVTYLPSHPSLWGTL